VSICCTLWEAGSAAGNEGGQWAHGSSARAGCGVLLSPAALETTKARELELRTQHHGLGRVLAPPQYRDSHDLNHRELQHFIDEPRNKEKSWKKSLLCWVFGAAKRDGLDGGYADFSKSGGSFSAILGLNILRFLSD
jgi:hypothetical protein